MNPQISLETVVVNNIFKENKLKILKGLGSSNPNELLEVTLKEGFKGDKFRENDEKIFKNFFVENQNSNNSQDNFLKSFDQWSKNKIDQSLKVRFRVMILNVLLLFGAFGISFVNPIGGMTFGIISSIACAITEGVAKRNISNIGHLQTHFGNKIEEATKDLIKNVSHDDDFKVEAKTTLNELQKPINFKYTSATSRGLSYFSGFAISSIFNITNRITPISEIASPIIFGAIGSIIPLLPLLVYFFSSKSANKRCQTLSNRSEYFNQINDIIFRRDNWNVQDTQNPQDINSKLNGLTDKFNSHIRDSDCDGRLTDNPKFKKNPESDYQYNPTKAVILPQYLSAKIHRQLNDKFVGHQNKDLADFNQNIEYSSNVTGDLVVKIPKNPNIAQDAIEVNDTTTRRMTEQQNLTPYPSPVNTPMSSPRIISEARISRKFVDLGEDFTSIT